jgi:hypothetical protein
MAKVNKSTHPASNVRGAGTPRRLPTGARSTASATRPTALQPTSARAWAARKSSTIENTTPDVARPPAAARGDHARGTRARCRAPRRSGVGCRPDPDRNLQREPPGGLLDVEPNDHDSAERAKGLRLRPRWWWAAVGPAENRDTLPYQRLCGQTADQPSSPPSIPTQHDRSLWPSDSPTSCSDAC